ncbi:hypothetical protein C1637_24570 [Chryseobacterium lactis]|uniref:CPBP family intramembrane metalloprotease n=1 Tax=Chryseobacterium lactis TaxID=1241981 RepID=A0A3G6RZD9_CHRLC|nr:CPBP family glutamic-type intramembrane protease [Chryseobacterium lactis]AZA81982.1 CPBP family intramembrane metalloprotease [Chryseobacterium lactis]AZB06980.1 CPBP family intramembrane metalloprotease [Chryseobacterium lactis]PNW11073.1 hypothetical protein C1637_24570 [Chryseobacterium lactis]
MKTDKSLSIFTHFLKFVHHPSINKSSNPIVKNLLQLLLLFFLGLIIRFLIAFLRPYFIDAPMKDNLTSYEISIFEVFLTCLLVPLLEELAFRLPLYFSKINLSISTTIISFFIVNRFFHLEDQYDLKNDFFFRVLIAYLLGFLMWLIVKNYGKFFEDFYHKRLGIIVYSYSLFFAFMHIANYEVSSNYLLTSLFIIIPHFISGLILSFVRLNYGFFYSLFLHILNNSLPFIILSII